MATSEIQTQKDRIFLLLSRAYRMVIAQNNPSRAFFLMLLTCLTILSRMSRDQDTSWCRTWGILAGSSAWTPWFHSMGFLPKCLLFLLKCCSLFLKRMTSACIRTTQGEFFYFSAWPSWVSWARLVKRPGHILRHAHVQAMRKKVRLGKEAIWHLIEFLHKISLFKLWFWCAYSAK